MRSVRTLLKKRKVYSEPEGGDGLLEYVFSKLFTDTLKSSNWLVEFGVHGDNGVYLDHFINKGYNAILIESERENYLSVKNIYSTNKKVICINSTVMPSGSNSLDKILSQTNLPKYFDALLIDVDSIDYQIWESFNNYMPMIVIIEFNELYGPYLERIHDLELNKYVGGGSVIRGSSIQSMVKLAKSKGYSLLVTLRNNAFFIRKEFLHVFHLREVDIEKNFGLSLMYIPSDILSYKQRFEKARCYKIFALKQKIKRFLGMTSNFKCKEKNAI